ncbi:MAG TPA: response regulator [Roseiflexaceae bacterium]|nr:response regulator [Roseiflexaceae bacterium]
MATILVVDDYTTSQRLLSFILRQNNHTVVTAMHGLGALEQLEKISVELVITDLRMPEMDGLALLHALRADRRYQNIPVIILTGSAYEQDNARAKAAGATSFLTKPVESEELIAMVNRLLGQSEASEPLSSLLR